MNGIYYIETTKNEWTSGIDGFFNTLEEAKEALKECSNWYRPKGTGKIFFKEFGLNTIPKLIYNNY